MPKLNLDWRARLTLATMVAEEFARVFSRATQVAKVGLYGSVARATPGHYCGDVDLLLFLENADSVEWVQSQPAVNRLDELLTELNFRGRRVTARQRGRLTAVARGFCSPSDRYDLGDRAPLPVPVSINLLPARLDVDTLCAFQAAQRDPQFLAKIGRDLLTWDSRENRFVRQGAPWDRFPWREHLPHWLTEHDMPPITATLAVTASTPFVSDTDRLEALHNRPLVSVMSTAYDNHRLVRVMGMSYDNDADDSDWDDGTCIGCLQYYEDCQCWAGCPKCGSGSCNCAYT